MPMGNKEYEQDTQTLGGAYKQFVVWDRKWVYVDPAKVPGEGQAGSRPRALRSWAPPAPHSTRAAWH